MTARENIGNQFNKAEEKKEKTTLSFTRGLNTSNVIENKKNLWGEE